MAVKNGESKRDQWMRIAQELTMLSAQRLDIYDTDVAPDRHVDEADRAEAKKKIADLSAQIGSLSGRLAIVERDGSVGSRALVGHDDDLCRIVLAMLVTARLSAVSQGIIRQVYNVMDLASGRDPTVCLAVRNLFRADGLLRKHVHLAPSPVLDEAVVHLRESAFNFAVGQPGDGADAACDDVGMAGNPYRRR